MSSALTIIKGLSLKACCPWSLQDTLHLSCSSRSTSPKAGYWLNVKKVITWVVFPRHPKSMLVIYFPFLLDVMLKKNAGYPTTLLVFNGLYPAFHWLVWRLNQYNQCLKPPSFIQMSFPLVLVLSRVTGCSPTSKFRSLGGCRICVISPASKASPESDPQKAQVTRGQWVVYALVN